MIGKPNLAIALGWMNFLRYVAVRSYYFYQDVYSPRHDFSPGPIQALFRIVSHQKAQSVAQPIGN